MAKVAISSNERSTGFVPFCIASVLLVGSWIAFSTAAGQSWLANAESHTYLALSSRLGRSQSWDAVMAFAAGRHFVYLAIVLGVLSVLREGWATRHRHYGRVFGFIAVTVLATAGVEQIADSIADEVHRPSPWVELGQPKLSPGLSHDLIDFRHRAATPDEDMLAWAFATFMLFGRLRVSALASFGFLALQTLGNLSMGHEWLATEWLSILGGMAAAGAFSMASRRATRWVEKKAEASFLRVFWRSFNRGQVGFDSKDAQPLLRAQKARRRDLDRAWHELISQRVLPLLAPGGGSYRLLQSPPVIGETESRGSTFVRFLVLPDGQTVVLKHVRRPRGIFRSPSRIRLYLASARASLVLERLGLPVPRTFWMETSGPRVVGIWHQFFSVEEFLVGRPLERDRADDGKSAMELLARLHSHTAEGWGRVSDSRTSSLGLFLLKGLRPVVIGDLERAANYITPVRPNQDLIEAWWRRFEAEFRAVVAARRPFCFRLIHGDVTWRNFHFDRADKARMIDFVTVRYDLSGTEIIKAALSLNDGSPESILRDWKSYFAAAGPEAWDEFRAEAQLAYTMYSLREFSKGRVPLALRKPNAARFDAWLTPLLESGPLFGNSPEETKWTALLDLMHAQPDAQAHEGIA